MFPVPVFLVAMFLILWSQLAVLFAAVSCPQKRLYPLRCLFIDVVCASCPFIWFFVVALFVTFSTNDLIPGSASRCEGCWLRHREPTVLCLILSLTSLSEL